MKLIQLNIWQGRLMGGALRFFEQERPDILCLQELCSCPVERTGFHDNYQDLQRAMGFPHAYFSPLFDWQEMGLKIEFGNAIFSRFPITKQQTVFTHLEYKSDFKAYKDTYNIRNFQHVLVEDGDTRVNIINHHGHHVPQNKHGNDETTRQMDMIADFIDGLVGPVVFAGDLNLSPRSKSLSRLNGMLDNLCIANKVTNTRNFITNRTDEVCDYIFVNGELKVKSFRVAEEVVSDHQALVLEFDAKAP